MKFEIMRASQYGRDVPQPCANAQQDDRGDWFVEIQTLDDLLRLNDEVGSDLIVGKSIGGPRIWIYDDYME